MIRLKENGKEIDAVVFDLGNVLLDYKPRRFMGEMGIPMSLHDRLSNALFDGPEWNEMDRGTLTREEFIEAAARRDPMMRKEIKTYMNRWDEFFHAIPENVESVYRIKEAGGKVFVLSNFCAESFRYIVKRNAFFQEFDGMIISYQHHLVKPDPAIYRLLIDTMKMDPGRTVFFDDVPENAAAAVNTGMNAVQLPDGGLVLDYLTITD